MKRIRVSLSILLATVLLLIPGVALADDPPGLEVAIGIISGGDVDVDLGIDAGGDVSIDVGTNSDVNVNGDNLVTQDDLTAATTNDRAGQYEDFVCGGSRMAIKDIYRILEEILGRQYIISSGLHKEIMLAENQQVRLNWADVNQKNQNSMLASLGTYDAYLNEKMDILTDTANHQVSDLSQRLAQQEQAQLAMWQDYNLKLFIASGIAIALAIVIIVLLARRKREV